MEYYITTSKLNIITKKEHEDRGSNKAKAEKKVNAEYEEKLKKFNKIRNKILETIKMYEEMLEKCDE